MAAGRGEPRKVAARPGTRAPLAGVVVSLVIHVVLVWWNPVLHRRADDALQAGPRAATWQVPPLHPVPAAVAESGEAEARTAQPASSRIAALPPVRRDSALGTAPGVAPATPALRERLSYRPGALWTPSSPRYETFEECRQRELTERLDSLARDPEYGRAGNVPPPAPPGGGGIGIRIPFGRKPPPPPQPGTPPPLPDSLRMVTPRPPPGVATLRRAPGCRDTIPPLVPRGGQR